MPRIADYAVVTDGKFTLQQGGDIDWAGTVSLEGGAHIGSRSILAFSYSVTGPSINLKFEVKIGSTPQAQQVVILSLAPQFFSTVHEVIAKDVLTAGANKIEFRILSGPGILQVTDVILFYQRDV